MRFWPTIWYRFIAVFKTGTKTLATWPALGRICSNCSAVTLIVDSIFTILYTRSYISHWYQLAMIFVQIEPAGRRAMGRLSKRGWAWAYRKIREQHCSRLSSAYRAFLFVIRGDTGRFRSEVTWQVIRIRR